MKNITGQVIVDLDGVLVLALSEKQDADATWKKTFGHRPLMGFVDYVSGGSGKPVAAEAGHRRQQHRAAGHITTAQLALGQLPKKSRRGRRTLIRTDSGGALASSSPDSPSGAGGCRTRSA